MVRRRLPAAQPVVAVVGVGLLAAAVVVLIVAAGASGTDCTFDHVSCRRNVLLGTGLRCLIGAVVAGAVWAALRAWRRRRG